VSLRITFKNVLDPDVAPERTTNTRWLDVTQKIVITAKGSVEELNIWVEPPAKADPNRSIDEYTYFSLGLSGYFEIRNDWDFPVTLSPTSIELKIWGGRSGTTIPVQQRTIQPHSSERIEFSYRFSRLNVAAEGLSKKASPVVHAVATANMAFSGPSQYEKTEAGKLVTYIVKGGGSSPSINYYAPLDYGAESTVTEVSIQPSSNGIPTASKGEAIVGGKVAITYTAPGATVQYVSDAMPASINGEKATVEVLKTPPNTQLDETQGYGHAVRPLPQKQASWIDSILSFFKAIWDSLLRLLGVKT
jgi:hypothetical protein